MVFSVSLGSRSFKRYSAILLRSLPAVCNARCGASRFPTRTELAFNVLRALCRIEGDRKAGCGDKEAEGRSWYARL